MGLVWLKRTPTTTNGWIPQFSWGLALHQFQKKTAVNRSSYLKHFILYKKITFHKLIQFRRSMLHHSNGVVETSLFETERNLHIKNSFDHFSDELAQTVQIWHVYFVKYIVMWNHILKIDSTLSEHGASYLLGLISISKQMLHFFRWDLFGNWHSLYIPTL